MKTEDLFSARTTTGYSKSMRMTNSGAKSVQARGRTSGGAGAAVIKVWVSNWEDASEASNDFDWVLAGTITLTLSTDNATDGFAIAAAWKKVRAEVDSISGTGANVDVVIANN